MPDRPIDTADMTPAEAEQEMRAAGYEPLEAWPGLLSLWKVECTDCGSTGRTTADQIRNGKDCPCRREAREAERAAAAVAAAVADAKAAGFMPLTDYPGSIPWEMECLTCGRKPKVRIGEIRRGRRCAHGKRGPSAAAAAAAVADAKAAGFMPLTDYPGSIIRWEMECLTCGRKRKIRIGEIRHGRRCAHGKRQSKKADDENKSTDAPI